MFAVRSESRSDRADPVFIPTMSADAMYLADVVAGERRLIELYRRALEGLAERSCPALGSVRRGR